MSTDLYFEASPGAIPGMPDPMDLADLWLVHALSWLLDACDVPVARRRLPLEAGDLTFWLPPNGAFDNARRCVERLDASRLAVLFAALAVEARLDRLLRQRDPSDWPAVAHLATGEKFRLAPRLLDGSESLKADRRLCNLADELFTLRDELVDAVGRPGEPLTATSPKFSPSRTRAMVGTSARICDFLTSVAHEVKGGTARLVREAAEALAQRADAVSAGGSLSETELGWSEDIDFPPDFAAT
jgi:hypothetical protein